MSERSRQSSEGVPASDTPVPVERGVPESLDSRRAHPPPPKRSLGSEIWQEWVRPFILVLLAVSTFRSAVADWNDVPTGSMKPTILPGERIFVNKVAYDLKVPFTRFRLARWSDPGRGDVVVLFSPADEKRLVKRIVGLPGDRIEMDHNRLYVNGEEADYADYAPRDLQQLGFQPGPAMQVLTESVEEDEHPVLWVSYSPVGSSFPEIGVPEGKYFVMGDNRNQSRDSRWFGFVDRRRIVGEATAVVVSFDRERSFTPRWDRFFQELP